MKKYIPQKGDLISLSFDPQSGHEQKGRRPALVISNTMFNERTGLAIICPITTAVRGWPIHVALPNKSALTGFIMVEQIKSVDFNTRNAKFIDKANEATLSEVLAILDAIIYD